MLLSRTNHRNPLTDSVFFKHFKSFFNISLPFFLLFLTPRLTISNENIHRSINSKQAFQRAYPRLLKVLNKKNLSFGAPIYIRIFKQESELEIWLLNNKGNYGLLKTYGICHHSGTLGPKQKEGDKQSPEGFYQIDRDQMNPWSKYHLAFNLGYPNEYDLFHRRTGGALMIHGGCSSVGCFAMTDYYMDEIYTIADSAIKHGQKSFKVHIFPFRFDHGKLSYYRQSRWINFWISLKEGYDYFERYHIPPEVFVANGRYVFNSFKPNISTTGTKSISGNKSF